MSNHYNALAFFFFITISISSQSLAVESVVLEDVPVIKLNNGKLSFFRDPSGSLHLKDIQKAHSQGEFKPLKGNLSAGYVQDTFWLHLSLKRVSSYPKDWWLEVLPPYLDNIQLFHINTLNQLDHRRSGDFMPQADKEDNYRGSLFKLALDVGTHEIYIKLKTTSTMVAMVNLWQPKAFGEHLRNSYFLFGLYFSLILTVLIFNMVNFILSRRIIFIVYVFYLALNSIQWLGILGFISEFVFQSQPLFANLTLGISLSLSAAMAFVFFTLLFELKTYHPYIYRFNLFGTIFSIATAIATPLGYYQIFAPWMLFIAIASISLAPWPIIRLWRSQEVWARLLAVAHLFFVTLVSLNILGSLALIPFNELTVYAGMASNTFHLSILHFGIMLHYIKIENNHKKSIEKSMRVEQQFLLEKAHNKEQSQLLSMITHEIRTPMTVISAANESLRLIDEIEQITDENRSRRYDRIQKSIMRMNLVMEMAQLQTDEKASFFEVKSFDIYLLTKEVTNLCGSDAEKRIILDYSERKIWLEGDVKRIKIALLNLVDNSLKYSNVNTPIIIKINPIDHDGSLGIQWTIEDQGVGIPHSMEHKIFEKYQRGDERMKLPGMGLGLFLVSEIIQRHGGHINVKNSMLGGAVFTLWLPLRPHQ